MEGKGRMLRCIRCVLLRNRLTNKIVAYLRELSCFLEWSADRRLNRADTLSPLNCIKQEAKQQAYRILHLVYLFFYIN